MDLVNHTNRRWTGIAETLKQNIIFFPAKCWLTKTLDKLLPWKYEYIYICIYLHSPEEHCPRNTVRNAEAFTDAVFTDSLFFVTRLTLSWTIGTVLPRRNKHQITNFSLFTLILFIIMDRSYMYRWWTAIKNCEITSNGHNWSLCGCKPLGHPRTHFRI